MIASISGSPKRAARTTDCGLPPTPTHVGMCPSGIGGLTTCSVSADRNFQDQVLAGPPVLQAPTARLPVGRAPASLAGVFGKIGQRTVGHEDDPRPPDDDPACNERRCYVGNEADGVEGRKARYALHASSSPDRERGNRSSA